MAKLYTTGPQSLHDVRRILLGTDHVIMHTGRVNSYARCMGGKLRGAAGVMEARRIMAASVSACGGVAGGKRRRKATA